MHNSVTLLQFVPLSLTADQRAIIIIGGRFSSVLLNPQPLPPRW